MKPADRLERLIKETRYRADAETYDKALGSYLQAVDEHIEHKSVLSEPKIWRKIVKSRMTKLAVAAVIIIAAYLVVHQSGGSIDVATVSFAQITENMKQMPWMHAVIKGAGEDMEGWFCFERRMVIYKRANGQVRYQDGLKQIVQLYDPNTNTVAVSHGASTGRVWMTSSAAGFPKMLIKMFEEMYGDTGDKVVEETGKYRGRDVKIFKMSRPLGDMDMKAEMTVDAKRNILLLVSQKAYDKAGKLAIEANGHFDYPEKGPASIHHVGVPRSAKIVRKETEKEKTDYDKAFAEAISAVSARENWPEPRDLAIAYWRARNAKKYDEMAMYWPGSATWNRRVVEKEEPVEYVFGDVQPWEVEDHVIVPYASRSYYDKHGKYSLKMVLSNKNSEKKRYYIVSGN
jgi:hypothetical protein